MRLFDRYHSLSVFPLEHGSAQAVCSGAAVGASGHFVICLSVALFHLLFLSVAGIVLGHLLVFFLLAVAAASGVPDFVWRLACPAAVDTYCPLLGCPCLSPCTHETELRSRGCRGQP